MCAFFALDSNYMDAKQLACDGRFVPLNRVRRKTIDPLTKIAFGNAVSLLGSWIMKSILRSKALLPRLF
jgi:hypothetical protein